MQREDYFNNASRGISLNVPIDILMVVDQYLRSDERYTNRTELINTLLQEYIKEREENKNGKEIF